MIMLRISLNRKKKDLIDGPFKEKYLSYNYRRGRASSLGEK
jgi:hypothetical protein